MDAGVFSGASSSHRRGTSRLVPPSGRDRNYCMTSMTRSRPEGGGGWRAGVPGELGAMIPQSFY